jgi:molybdopterin synthase catalytic subunit
MFEVTEQVLDANVVLRKVAADTMGAVVTFVGIVRGFSEGRKVLYLEYEAYKEMAEKKLAEVGQEISRRWPTVKVAVTHRVGHLEVGEAAVVIAVAAPHRGEAFEACKYAIDRLKEIVPIWKKEVWEDGEGWIG